jgi:hypothetical protein
MFKTCWQQGFSLTILEGKGLPIHPDRVGTGGGKDQGSMPEGGLPEERHHVRVGNEPEFMAWEGSGHLIKKAEREGECIAAITPSASG